MENYLKGRVSTYDLLVLLGLYTTYRTGLNMHPQISTNGQMDRLDRAGRLADRERERKTDR
jgi:hypothetical protein